jgi:hypothetical protein
VLPAYNAATSILAGTVAFAALVTSAHATPAAVQRAPIGVYQTWGAFREANRCFAIAEPPRVSRRAEQRPFVAVGFWPTQDIRGQLQVRFSRVKRAGSAVLLRIDGRSFQLIAGSRDAWAPDRRADAGIVAAMRTGLELVVETRSTAGTLVRDRYALRGAATAIDAAAIACAGQGAPVR